MQKDLQMSWLDRKMIQLSITAGVLIAERNQRQGPLQDVSVDVMCGKHTVNIGLAAPIKNLAVKNQSVRT